MLVFPIHSHTWELQPMDLVQIGRLSFTLVADAVSGRSAGSSTSEAAEPQCAQLSSSTAMKDLLHAAQAVEHNSADTAASGGNSDAEVEFLRVVAPIATIAATATAAAAATATAAAAGASCSSQTSTPQSAGAVSAPARSTKHRSVMRDSNISSSSSSSYHAKQTLEKLEKRSHKQQQPQRRSEGTTARCCTDSAEDSSEEDNHVGSGQIVLHDGDDASAAGSDSSEMYESFRHYTREPAAAHSEQSSPTASVARALFKGTAVTTAATAGSLTADTQSDAAAQHGADACSADDSMQVDSGADYDDGDGSAHAYTAAASDNNTASTAPVSAVAVPADVVDLVSDSEEDVHNTTSHSGSSSNSTTAESASVVTVSVPAASGSSSSSSSAFSSALSKRSGKRKARPRAAVGVADLLDWCCKQCTLINAGSANVCAACGGSKPSLTRGALVRNGSPVCNDSMCTSTAAVVGTAAAAAAVDTAVNFDAGWACDFCDTLNTAAATRCTDCDYPPGVLSNEAEQRSNEPVCKSAAGSTNTHCHDADVAPESTSSKIYKPLIPLKTRKVSMRSFTVMSLCCLVIC
jgi:hypothetical protein